LREKGAHRYLSRYSGAFFFKKIMDDKLKYNSWYEYKAVILHDNKGIDKTRLPAEGGDNKYFAQST
jgi:hypothetical protein